MKGLIFSAVNQSLHFKKLIRPETTDFRSFPVIYNLKIDDESQNYNF